MLINLIFCLGLFFISWIFAKKINFYSIVDVLWSFAFSGTALIIFLDSEEKRLASPVGLLACMYILWSTRLGLHLSKRLLGHYPEEDTRHKSLKKDWAAKLDKAFLIFFLSQGLSVFFLSAPLFIAATKKEPQLSWAELIGVFIWIIALAGEGLADKQLSNFRKNPANRGLVCEVGLWNYSRHPNYFFEWLVWVSFFIFNLDTGLGWVAIYCPIAMLYLLFKITGIPANEEQSLKSKGDLYRQYQHSTSVFVPWFKNKKPQT